MKKGTKSIGKTVTIVILIILLIAAVGYIGYDKLLKKDITKKTIESKKEETETKELDINSRLVQNLYSKVSTGENKEEKASFNFNYMYKDKDFYADKADEQQKMSILSRLIDNRNGEYSNCNNTKIPDTFNTSTGSYVSICNWSKENGTSAPFSNNSIYSKEYISYLYKELYGQKATLDTNIEFYDGNYGCAVYTYVSSIDSYVYYVHVCGETTGPGGSYANITKAVKESDKLMIYEKVTTLNYENEEESQKKITTSNYIYTFNLEDDGMYSFHSRVKES